MSERLTIILTHQSKLLVERMVAWWREWVPESEVLVAYGGSQAVFESIDLAAKVFVGDERLKTRDHQRERQSFAGVFASARQWLQDHRHYRCIHFTEFDCIPLRRDFYSLLETRLAAEGADVIGCGVEQIDGTNHPHYLYHLSDPEFTALLQRLSRRAQRDVVLSMLGCFSFWKRDAFLAVAEQNVSLPIYLEIALPTLAHHLGFRLRGLQDQDPFIKPRGDFLSELDALRDSGAWMAHPVKGFWEQLLATDGSP